MPEHNSFTGFAIALAWPATYCKQPGSWYDDITHLLNISTNRFYQVGHAALVLVEAGTRKCHYFDFGRYHAPFKHGRVRGEITDPGLTIRTKAELSEDGGRIDNFREILEELQSNHECHGDGDLHAAYCGVNFEKAFAKARQMQEDSPIPYGPFKRKGSNCSRFVCTSILAGNPAWNITFDLKYLVFLTPTPLNNVNALKHKSVVPKPFYQPVLKPAPFKNKPLLKDTLPEPEKPWNIPLNAQWLSGEGAGSWFSIEKHEEEYWITRFNDAGETECKGIFTGSESPDFNIERPYQFVHLSHCNQVRIKQDKRIITFQKLEEERHKATEGKLSVEEEMNHFPGN
ncbi:MAG: DUF6695 family protein [Marinilabilia sp.]